MQYRIEEIRKTKTITKTTTRTMSQEDLAELSGVSRTTISKLESGENPEVKTGTLKAIADALEVSVSELFG